MTKGLMLAGLVFATSALGAMKPFEYFFTPGEKGICVTVPRRMAVPMPPLGPSKKYSSVLCTYMTDADGAGELDHVRIQIWFKRNGSELCHNMQTILLPQLEAQVEDTCGGVK